MERSIAEAPDGPHLPPQPRFGRATAVVVGLLLALAALVLYTWSNPQHYNQYNHFVWQADAFLHGKVSFDWPVPDGADRPPNWYFNDIYPLFDVERAATGQVLLPFPPLPALVLLPFVAASGCTVDQEAIAVALAAIGVGVAWWMLGGLRIRLAVRALTTILFATGTVWWWAAAVGSTWYLAHLVAVDRGAARRRGGPPPRSIRAPETDAPEIAADVPADRRAIGPRSGPSTARRCWPASCSGSRRRRACRWCSRRRSSCSSAAAARRRAGRVSAAVGGVVPVAALLIYTFLTTGSFLHPGYDYQYQLEANGYPTLGYNPSWSVEDPRYIPQNLGIMFGALPVIAPALKPNTLNYGDPVVLCATPDAQRTLFDPTCPLLMPIDIGTSIILSAPGLLLALFAVFRRPRARLTIGAGATVILIALFNLAHFSQGWVQWGYRFSLDFIPFLLPLVALGAARVDGRPRGIAVLLVIAGATVNLWGVIWGQLLGW